MFTLINLPFARKPYKVKWRDPFTRQSRSHSFNSREEADHFIGSLGILFEKEKRLVSLAKRRERAKFDTRMTVADLVEEYLSGKDLRPVTRKAHGQHASHFLRLFGARRANSLQPGDLEAFAEAQKLRGVSAATIRLRIVIIKAAYSWGVKTGRIRFSPIRDFPTPRPRARRVAPPSLDELDRMYEHAPAHLRRVILLGLYLGARIGPSELFRLRWQHVDIRRGIILVPSAAKRAGDDMRLVPIRADLLPFLEAWRREDGACPWVINYRGREVKRINHAWRASRRKAGITRAITPYSLRHAYATQSLLSRADLGAVCQIMGHTSSKMVTEVYQHVEMALLIEAVSAAPPLACMRQAA